VKKIIITHLNVWFGLNGLGSSQNSQTVSSTTGALVGARSLRPMKMGFVVSWGNPHMGSLRLNRVSDWLHATTLLGSHWSQLDLSLSLSFALLLFQALSQQGPELTIGA
jgi:hypothetical protein